MFEIAGLILFAVMVIGSISWTLYHDKRHRTDFLEFCQGLGLTNQVPLNPWSYIDFQGEIEGREIQILRRNLSGRGPRPTDFGVRVQTPPDFEFALLTDPAADMKRIPLVGIVIGKTLDGVKAMDHVEDLTTGFPDFDRDWLVSSNRIDLLRAILTDPVRQKLNDLREVGPQSLKERLQGEMLPLKMPVNLQLQEGVLCLYLELTCHNISYLRKVMNHLLFIAREIDRACDGWM